MSAYNTMNPYGSKLIDHPRKTFRDEPGQHVAAVERRNRNHVEHGQEHVDDDRHRQERGRRHPVVGRDRIARQQHEKHRDGDRDDQIADRSRERDDGEVAARMTQIAHVDGHRLRPADDRQARVHRENREQHRADPVDMRERVHVSRPSMRAVGRPARSAVQACAAS
jgi:hypothetical protein